MLRRHTCCVPVFLMLAVAVPALGGDDRPFKGHADATVMAAEPGADGLHLTVIATGQVTHLGQFTRDEHTVVSANGTFTGTLVFTAANGDQLFASLAGGFILPTTALGTYTFTGGTGRFANASGAADFEGVTVDGVHISLKFEGTISY